MGTEYGTVRWVRWQGTVCTLVRYSRYAGAVRWVQWYGTVGTLVRYGGTAQGHTVPQQAYQNLESFHNQFCTFDNQFCTFDNQICTFYNQILGTLRWYGALYHCTIIPYHCTVPYLTVYPTGRTKPPYRSAHRTQPYVPQKHPKPHSYVPGPSEDPPSISLKPR